MHFANRILRGACRERRFRHLAFAAAHRSEFLDRLFGGISWLGSLYVLVPIGLVVLALLLVRGNRIEALLLGTSLSGAALLAQAMKWAVARPRPELYPLSVELPVSYSFPSAHVAQASAFCLCLTLIVRRLRPAWTRPFACAALCVVTAVAVSRVYLLVHFPSDALGGFGLALLWVAVLYRRLLA